MGITHVNEYIIDDGLLSIDIALPEEKIAIEVDGAHHFTRNTLRPVAQMFARITLLEARGYTVVSVPFYLWHGAEDSARRALLKSLLEKARAGKAAHPTKEDQGARLRS